MIGIGVQARIVSMTVGCCTLVVATWATTASATVTVYVLAQHLTLFFNLFLRSPSRGDRLEGKVRLIAPVNRK